MYASLSVMHGRTVTHLIALTTVIFQSAGELVTAPQDAIAKVGDTTYFNCSTNLTSVDINWRHGQDYLSSGDSIVSKKYEVRFEIDTNASNGSYNLVIHSVEPGDAGEYICFEVKAQAPPKRSAKLVVLENDPDCQSNLLSDGVVGQNVFNIPAGDVQLTCNVTYYGNTPPQMEWIKVGDSGPIKENVTSELKPNNRLIYSLKLKGDISLHESSYICQTSRSTQNQYNCTSETIRVLYFVGGNTTQQNVVRGDKITCITNNNSTFPCASQWYHDNYNTCPFSCDEAITAHLLGEYRCRLKCHFRKTDYYFDTMKVVVVETPTPPQTGKIVAVTLVSIIFVIIMAVSITVSVIYYKRKDAPWISSERELLKRLLNKKAHCTTCVTDKGNMFVPVLVKTPEILSATDLKTIVDQIREIFSDKSNDIQEAVLALQKYGLINVSIEKEGIVFYFCSNNLEELHTLPGRLMTDLKTTIESIYNKVLSKNADIELSLDDAAFKKAEKKLQADKVAEEKSKPKFERTIKENGPKTKGMITGMAVLNEELFIVREKRPELEVYNLKENLTDSRFIKVEELATALDICSCKVNNCLYIMHEKMCRIFGEVLKINKDGKVLNRWLTKDNAKGNLSTCTPGGNVVITDHDKHMLLEYSSGGKFSHCVKLPEGIYPLHAIKAANDQYIVSHGSLVEFVHAVYLVDRAGAVNKIFGHAMGCGDDQLNMPYYLAVGSSGCVTVVDLFNDRLLSLNSDLKYTAEIKLPHDHGFIFPTGVCQDEQRLVVVVIDRAQEKLTDQEGKSTKEEVECSATNESTGLMEQSENSKQEFKYKLLFFDPKLLVN